jgi:hypothetical protein
MPGVVDALLAALPDPERDIHVATTPIRLPRTKGKLGLWSAGVRDHDYYKRVRTVDLRDFYQTSNGGAKVEALRAKLKQKHDFVLVDSRTGLTEVGGLCTVQLPDMIVLLFTPTEQALMGGIDVVNRAAAARQRLPYERPHIPVIPIPSRVSFDAEFRLSQKWLDRFERELTPLYTNWLPRSVRPRSILELVKLPHVTYFSYGESLPVLEQGTTDPAGLGYAYENVAALIASKLQDIELFMTRRDEFTKRAARGYGEVTSRGNERKVFISYSHADRQWLERLQKHLRVVARSRNLEIWADSAIDKAEKWQSSIMKAINEADVAVLLVSPDYLASDFIMDLELPALLKAAEERGLRILWLPCRPSIFAESPISGFQAALDPSKPLASLSAAEIDESLVKATRLIAEAAGRTY